MFPPVLVSAFDQFAFWGMSAIVVFYMIAPVEEGGVGLPAAIAFATASAYAGSVYLLTLFTAWLADRVIGSETVLRWGAIVAILGYAALAFAPGVAGLAVGLVAITLGTAGMIVNEGTLVGAALTGFESKRDAAFTVYYAIGATGLFLGVTLMGIVQEIFGFQIAFASCAGGLAVGLAIYLPHRKTTADIAPKIDKSSRASGPMLTLSVSLVSAGVIGVVGASVAGLDPALIITILATLLVITYFGRFFTSKRVTPHEKVRIVRYLPYFFATLVFCALYQQLFTTIAVFSETETDRFIFGLEIPPTTVLGIAPLCTILSAPLLALIWGRLGPRQPSTSIKFAMTFVLIAFALVLLALAAATGTAAPLAVLLFLVFVIGVSDAVTSPTGISVATDVAPKQFQTQMLSVHFVGVAVGTAASGLISQSFVLGENEDAYFFGLAVIAAAVVVAMVVARFTIARPGLDSQ
jgi:POT family proton-dependent oligopeptide transporter